MTPLLVLALLAVAVLVVFFSGESPFVVRASRVGGLAFIFYGFVLLLIWVMGLVKG